MKILPLSHNMFNRTEEGDDASKKKTPVDFSPSPVAVLRHIVPNYVKGLLYGAMVESYACEQSSRMTAMDNATTNAKEMITVSHLQPCETGGDHPGDYRNCKRCAVAE